MFVNADCFAYEINDFEQEIFALMKTEQGVGNWIREQLSKSYSLKQLDLGAEARMAKKGFTFETEAYKVSELGHHADEGHAGADADGDGHPVRHA